MTTVELPTAKYDSINMPAFMNWVLELESGYTQQGRNRLHTITPEKEESLCCLGVVSRQLAPELNLEVKIERFNIDYQRVTYGKSASFVSRNILKHLGIPETHQDDQESGWSVLVSLDEEAADKLNQGLSSVIYPVGEKISVHSLNDNGFSFVEIARLLRKEFLNA